MIQKMIVLALSLISLQTWSAPGKATVTIGQPAPDFTLSGVDGKSYKLSQFKGKTVVLEWFNKDCPYVRKFYEAKAMQALQKDNVGKGVVWLSIASSAEGKEGFLKPEEGKQLIGEWGMGMTALLLDPKGEVGRMYEARTTPHMFVVDSKGLLAYQGAMDDRPSASKKSLEGAQNYVSIALQSLAKGEAVKTASTTPYGCSVKY